MISYSFANGSERKISLPAAEFNKMLNNHLYKVYLYINEKQVEFGYNIQTKQKACFCNGKKVAEAANNQELLKLLNLERKTFEKVYENKLNYILYYRIKR